MSIESKRKFELFVCGSEDRAARDCEKRFNRYHSSYLDRNKQCMSESGAADIERKKIGKEKVNWRVRMSRVEGVDCNSESKIKEEEGTQKIK